MYTCTTLEQIMTRLIYYEVKKIFKKPNLILIIVSLLFSTYWFQSKVVLNGSNLNQIVTKDLNGQSLDQVVNEINEIDIEDYVVPSSFYSQISYLHDYESNINRLFDGISKDLTNNSLTKFIYNEYKDRKLEYYIYPKGFTEYLDNNLSTLFVLVVMGFVASALYSEEIETGVIPLQIATVYNKKLVLIKSIALLVVVILFMFIFNGFEALIYHRQLGLSSGNLPIYSLPDYASSPLNISIYGFIGIRFFFSVVGIWFFSLTFSLISMFSKNTFVALIVNFLLLAVVNNLPVILLSYLNPYTMFFSAKTFSDLNYVLLNNRIILAPFVNLLCSFVLIFFVIILKQIKYGGNL